MSAVEPARDVLPDRQGCERVELRVNDFRRIPAFHSSGTRAPPDGPHGKRTDGFTSGVMMVTALLARVTAT